MAFVLITLALVVLLSILGLTADSRNNQDWRPTDDGFPRRDYPAYPA